MLGRRLGGALSHRKDRGQRCARLDVRQFGYGWRREVATSTKQLLPKVSCDKLAAYVLQEPLARCGLRGLRRPASLSQSR